MATLGVTVEDSDSQRRDEKAVAVVIRRYAHLSALEYYFSDCFYGVKVLRYLSLGDGNLTFLCYLGLASVSN